MASAVRCRQSQTAFCRDRILVALGRGIVVFRLATARALRPALPGPDARRARLRPRRGRAWSVRAPDSPGAHIGADGPAPIVVDIFGDAPFAQRLEPSVVTCFVRCDRRTQAAGQDARQAAAAYGFGQADQTVDDHELDIGVVGQPFGDGFALGQFGADAGADIADVATRARRAAKVGADIAVAAAFAGRIAHHIVDAPLGDRGRLRQHPFEPFAQVVGARRQLDPHGAAAAVDFEIARRRPIPAGCLRHRVDPSP